MRQFPRFYGIFVVIINLLHTKEHYILHHAIASQLHRLISIEYADSGNYREFAEAPVPGKVIYTRTGGPIRDALVEADC